MALENRYRFIGDNGTRVLLLLQGTVYNNGDEQTNVFVIDPGAFLRQHGFHYHYLDGEWLVYEKNFGPGEGITVRFTGEANRERRMIEMRGIEQPVLDEKWHLGLKIE